MSPNRKNTAMPPEWGSLKTAVLLRDGKKCRKCGKRKDLTVHHIKPRETGGADHPRNLLTLCTSCHDWAEIETSENGLKWAELIKPKGKLKEKRIWFLDPADDLITSIEIE